MRAWSAWVTAFGSMLIGLGIPADLGVDLQRLELVGLDDLGVVRLAHADRHVVQQLHLVARLGDVHELEVLRAAAGRRWQKRSMDHLFSATRYWPSGRGRVALGGGDVADVVMHRQLLHQLPGLVGVLVGIRPPSVQRATAESRNSEV